MPAPLRVLVGSQFGLFFAGNSLSLIGTWMQRIACSWLVWEWTHSAFWVGVVSAGDLLPGFAIGPFAGVVADRWNRLRLNILAQSASALLALLTAVLIAMDHLGLIGLVILITLQGMLQAAIQPARMAMVQQMVPLEDLGTAVALNSVCVNLARILGPAVAGAMILYLDVTWTFALNALFTLIFVLVLTRLNLGTYVRRPRTRTFFGEMTEGFAHILQTQPLWLILLVMLCGGSMVRAMIELMPAIAAGTFTENAAGLAALTGAAAFGAVVSGLTIRSGSTARVLYRVQVWWGIGALGAIIVTQTESATIAIIASVIIGFTATRSLVLTQTFVQLATPDALRGRVLSVHGLIARGSPALGALIIGFAADRIGLSLTVELSSGVLILLFLMSVPFIRAAVAKMNDPA
ncbi:MFS transporter [Marinobacter bohaiensis]|uniref:MFS transporter n=1 Tax=Marinobacter bohaiensis TaxID=2201898 RepID=UPI000DAD4EC3|nr:MFS transporter [Marinobacter bohaiensis]